MKNPIINNRIVSNMTFAVRLYAFLERADVYDQLCEEERDYLMMVAKDLLAYQVETATEQGEVDYLKRVKVYEPNKKASTDRSEEG